MSHIMLNPHSSLPGNSSEMRKFLPLLLLFSFIASIFKKYVLKQALNLWKSTDELNMLFSG